MLVGFARRDSLFERMRCVGFVFMVARFVRVWYEICA